MNQIREYYFIPFQIYQTNSEASFVLKQPIKKYVPIRVKLAYIDHEIMYFKFPIESVTAIYFLKILYSDYISEPIPTNSIVRFHRLDCFETFEEADAFCERLNKSPLGDKYDYIKA